MTIVTLTGHLGSMGTIATEVATRLGYALADRELLLEAAEALRWSEDEVASFDERTQGQGGRLARFLNEWGAYMTIDDMNGSGLGTLAASTYADAAAVAEMRPRDRRYIDVLSELVRSLAERGDAVVVGRGGQALLAGREDTVHVRVICALDERIRRITTRDGMTGPAARARVEDSDRQRAAWHHKYFGVDYESPYLYHMVLNATWLPDARAADLVVQLVERRLPLEVPAAGGPAATHSKQDWGWIDLVHSETGRTHARAHLFATEVAADGWRGQLESVRVAAGEPVLSPGTYFARFPRSGADHLVDLDVTERGVRVDSVDADVPAIFAERAEGT